MVLSDLSRSRDRMLEPLSPRLHFAVFGPDLSYDDGFPAATDNAFLRFSVSGGSRA